MCVFLCLSTLLNLKNLCRQSSHSKCFSSGRPSFLPFLRPFALLGFRTLLLRASDSLFIFPRHLCLCLVKSPCLENLGVWCSLVRFFAIFRFATLVAPISSFRSFAHVCLCFLKRLDLENDFSQTLHSNVFSSRRASTRLLRFFAFLGLLEFSICATDSFPLHVSLCFVKRPWLGNNFRQTLHSKESSTGRFLFLLVRVVKVFVLAASSLGASDFSACSAVQVFLCFVKRRRFENDFPQTSHSKAFSPG